MSDKLLSVPAQIMKVSTMSHRSLRIVADTQENLTDDQMASLASLHEKAGHWCFLTERPIEAEDALNLPPLTKEEGKPTKSQRLRWKLRKLWQKNSEDLEEEAHYDKYMDKFSNWVDEKLT